MMMWLLLDDAALINSDGESKELLATARSIIKAGSIGSGLEQVWRPLELASGLPGRRFRTAIKILQYR